MTPQPDPWPHSRAGPCGSEHARGAGCRGQHAGAPSSRPCPFPQAVNHPRSPHERPVYALPAQGACLVPTILLLEGSRGCGNTAAPCAWPQRSPPLLLRWHLRPVGVRAARWLLGGPEPGGLFPPGSFSWPRLNGCCSGRRLPSSLHRVHARDLGAEAERAHATCWGDVNPPALRECASPRTQRVLRCPSTSDPSSVQPHRHRYTAGSSPSHNLLPSCQRGPAKAGRGRAGGTGSPLHRDQVPCWRRAAGLGATLPTQPWSCLPILISGREGPME